MEVDQFPLDLHWRWFDVALSWWRSPVEIARIQERISPELHHFQRDINTFYAFIPICCSSTWVPGRVDNLVDDSGSGCGPGDSRG